MLRFLNGNQNNFKKKLELILDKRKLVQKNKSNIVKPIIKNVKKNGDSAVIKYEKKFSRIKLKKIISNFHKKKLIKLRKKLIKN